MGNEKANWDFFLIKKKLKTLIYFLHLFTENKLLLSKTLVICPCKFLLKGVFLSAEKSKELQFYSLQLPQVSIILQTSFLRFECTDLFKDALQVIGTSSPEVKFYQWSRITTFYQWLSWISFQNTLYLMCPFNDYWFNRMNQTTIKWFTPS